MPGLHNFDLRYHHAWKASRSGHGFLTIVEKEAFQDRDEGSHDVKSETVEREVLERLVNYYFRTIAPVFPVVTEAEFLHGTGASESDNTPSDRSYRPAPVLLYAICTIAATARDVPSHVFESLRMKLNAVIRSDDVLSNATLVNIQALLIASMTAEPHGRVLSHSMSAGFLRAGTAIRMAQDLGLHRAEAVQTDIQLRRRLWSACVITDRWYGLIFGLPLMIDVHDCDARLPGPELIAGHPPLSASEAEYATSLAFMGEFVKLSVILGKVTKTIYSPTGLIHTTDEALERLLEELDRFIANLPPILRFTGRDSSIFAGLLQLFYVSVCMMFWRVFARIQYTVPSHLKFCLTVERWTDLTDRSATVIEWLDGHETIYDSWFFVAYSVTSCALIQYHTWARRKDTDAQDALRRLRDCVKRWDGSVEPGHMSSRRKTTEIISLLYEATQSPVSRNFWPLNPTPGVEARNNPEVDAIQFRKDPTRPGGGLFVATQRSAAALGPENIPRGTLVLADSSGASEAGSSAGGSSDSGHERKGEGKANVGAGLLYGGVPYQSNPVGARSSSSPNQPSQSPVVGQHLGLLRRMEPPPAVDTLSTSQTSGPSSLGMSGTHAGGTNLSPNMTGLDMGVGLMGTMPNPRGAMTTPANVNPNLNGEALSAFLGNGREMPQGVQVLNMLDAPQPSNPALMHQYATVNNGLLDGIPATMFEWGEFLFLLCLSCHLALAPTLISYSRTMG
ncbi:hypothetical protein BS47DRAFT_991537 [Hydnum rufescens UP504]|uniref:Xylanolytic transcriptional activator regulatory domain-containing protein n=1 Tax=Hydnum rufescens UP504 TaxID=1448309 RepID=A0A9P6AWC2_9AGAM|nr:hypothetical protein BS47DRAFT_991537 [Hydnum rufescens UP504]